MNTTDLKFNIRLLRCVKKYPVIYNTKLEEYKTRNCIDYRDAAWRDIAEELNCDLLPLKRKWKNFRSIATRNLRKEQMGQKVPPYYLHNEIKFVIPFLRTTCGPASSNKQIMNGVAKEEMEYDDDVHVDDLEHHCESDLEQSENENEDENPIFFGYDEDEILSQNTSTSKYLSEPEDTVEFDNIHAAKPAYDEKRWSKAVQNKIITQTPSHVASSSTENVDRERLASIEKAKKQFLDSLLPDINQMSHSQMRQFKYEVLVLIDKILIEN
uniref:Transcription factor Adf-1 n=2 Tax=Ceratitis capitata TaxID=7213 RepID=W8BE55_CERCA